MWSHFILLATLLVTIINQTTCDLVKEKFVYAKVSTKWTETPLLLEASEFIFRNNPSSFWKYAIDVTESQYFTSNNPNNNESYYNELLNRASKYLSPMQFDLLILTLSVRTHSPSIEMTRKLAQETLNVKCVTFVDVHGETSCDLDSIKSLVSKADQYKKPFIYQYDKVYNLNPHQTNDNRVYIILYALIGSNDFLKFHNTITGLQGSLPNIVYVLRHNYEALDDQNDENKISLSGYGVELDIKSTEYKAKDDTKVNADKDESSDKAEVQSESIQGFQFDKLKELNPQLKTQLEDFKLHLLDSKLEMAPLKAWEMQDLSFQAAQQILEAEPSDAMHVLEDLSQNFPLRARSLSKIRVKKELQKSFKAQRQQLESGLSMESGAGAFYLNGLEVNMDTIDIFTLNAMLRKESKLIEGLHQIGLTSQQLKDLVYLDTSSKNTVYGVDIRDSSIQWLNNLEKDSKYSQWGKSMQEILRPTYPGMMRSVAKNFFNLVFVLDPSKEESKTLLKTAESFYVNDLPVRIGFVFVSNNQIETDGFKEANVALYRVHNYIKAKTNSAYKALSFITDVYAAAPKNVDVTSDFIVKEFKRSYPKEKNIDDIFGVDSDYDEGRRLTMEYYNKIGLRNLPQVFINGYPLSATEMEGDLFEESVVTKIMTITPEIQMAVYRGSLYDSMNLLDWLMNKDDIMPRLNNRILSQERDFVSINNFDQNSKEFFQNLKYLSNEQEQVTPLTLWAVCDPDTEKGRQLLYDSISFYESSKINSRLALIVQKSSKSSDDSMKKAVLFALENLRPKEANKVIKKMLRETSFNEIKSKKKTFTQLDLKEFGLEDIDEQIEQFNIEPMIKNHKQFLSLNTLFKDSNHEGLIANGWMLGPFDENETFYDSDFSLLENFILKIGLKQIRDLIPKWRLNISSQKLNDMILMINCILGKHASTDKRVLLPQFTSGLVNVKPKQDNAPFYDMVVILDPLTRQAQRISTILKVLTQVTNVNLALVFNCKEKLSAPPLKSFYRYVLENEIKYSNGKLAKPLAYFHNMPQSTVLTMNIHPPESWMVEAVLSPYDLDNILLKDINNEGIFGEFELEHLILEGHAFDVLSGQSPRGLQFNLGTETNPIMFDTIVMANLGYFQLKSSPGIWHLQLREGRSKDIYEIVSHENTDSESKRSPTIIIVIDSFESKVIRVKVSKKADKINENLLDDKEAEKESSIWESIASKFSGSDTEVEKAKDEENVLNIFSLASGHLYERLMRIMMLTVLRNTKAKVKFWFLKNYLSPQFTRFLPYYSEKYGFDYELVQYKWPRWLHHESEKQRIIWGYKILFLDVLFPLNVEKIIYVDADQIVKADLTELRDIDLKGAPYGYTPFCDSRKEMDGYRFWKSGYWQMHLGHRKYHISALYVVDLKKFRKLAAGDRLRGQYQGLSQDPNSLSNLDQDLPNNMIHQVNIFSLPQEWLYCDTWCSSDTLSKAKTIDLCNNPQTKEPKLDQAVRIVPEWKDYDNEIKALMQKWQAENKTASRLVDVTTPISSTKNEGREDL